VTINIERQYEVPREFRPASRSDYVDVLFEFGVGDFHNVHILGRNPQVSVNRMTDGTGSDLLAAAKLGIENPTEQSQSAFLWPTPMDNPPRGDFYQYEIQRGIRFRNSRLPSEIAVLEGEARVDVVTRDAVREFFPSDPALSDEIAPGVELWSGSPPAGPDNGLHAIGISIDPAKAGKLTPKLFLFDASQDRRIQVGGPLGIAGKRFEWFAFPIDPARVDGEWPHRAHLVLESKTIVIPFRFEHVNISGANPSPITKPTRKADRFIASMNGYECALTRATVGRRVWFDWRVNNAPSSGLMLEFGFLDRKETRLSSTCPKFTVVEITDEDGQPIGQLDNLEIRQNRSRFGNGPFAPPIGVRAPRARTGESDRTVSASMPFDRVPARLGTVRGVVEFHESAQDIVLESKLVPSDRALVLAPGVRLTVHSPTAQTRQWRPDSPLGVVYLDIDQPDGDSSGPWFNSFQPILRNGEVGDSRSDFRVERIDGGARVFLYSGLEHAEGIRVQLIQQRVQRRLPFEFHDVPLGDR